MVRIMDRTSPDDVPQLPEFVGEIQSLSTIQLISMETGFQLVNQNCMRAKMPYTNYKNIFPHWDSQNKSQIVKQNRNNEFTRDSFFIIHTILFCIMHIYLYMPTF